MYLNVWSLADGALFQEIVGPKVEEVGYQEAGLEHNSHALPPVRARITPLPILQGFKQAEVQTPLSTVPHPSTAGPSCHDELWPLNLESK